MGRVREDKERARGCNERAQGDKERARGRNGSDVHHIYIVCGVKAHDDTTYVAIMDWCRTFESSGVLKQPMAGLIEYISNHDFAPEVICKVDE